MRFKPLERLNDFLKNNWEHYRQAEEVRESKGMLHALFYDVEQSSSLGKVAGMGTVVPVALPLAFGADLYEDIKNEAAIRNPEQKGIIQRTKEHYQKVKDRDILSGIQYDFEESCLPAQIVAGTVEAVALAPFLLISPFLPKSPTQMSDEERALDQADAYDARG